MSDEPCCMASAHDQKCGCRRKKRSFPDAADGRPSTPMAVELWAAGCDTDTSHFVARQLAFNRIAMIRHNDDGTVTYIGAEEWPVPAIEPVDPATIRAEALREAIAPQLSEGIGAILRKFCDSDDAAKARHHLHAMPDADWKTLIDMLADASSSAVLALIDKEQDHGR